MESTLIALVATILLTASGTLLLVSWLIRDMYGGSVRTAFSHVLALLTRRTRGYQIIDSGQTIFPSGDGPFLGPLMVIVRPGNAVSMVRGGQITHVTGPGIYRSREYEFVKDIHDLREQQMSYTFEDVLSRDTIEMTARVTVSFTVNVDERARQGAVPLSPEEQEILRRMPMNAPQWNLIAHGALEQALRHAVGAFTIRELISHAQLGTLERRVERMSNDKVAPWGLRIDTVIIECLRPKTEITEAAINRWVAASNINVEVAKSEGFRQALRIMADAYQDALDCGMSDEGIRGEIMRRTIEQLGKDPATKLVITPELKGDYPDVRRSIDLGGT
jgi:regulator of protease activity HflC (stomatin/prohibitin superfamily)